MELQKLNKLKPKINYSIFHSKFLTKIINPLIKCGKKEQMTTIIKNSLMLLKNPKKAYRIKNIDLLFQKAYRKLAPVVDIHISKKGTSKLYTPKFISLKKSKKMTNKWLLEAIKKHSTNITTELKLITELFGAIKRTGFIKQIRQTHYQLIMENIKFFKKYPLKFKKKFIRPKRKQNLFYKPFSPVKKSITNIKTFSNSLNKMNKKIAVKSFISKNQKMKFNKIQKIENAHLLIK